MRAVVFAYSQVGYRCLETLLQTGDEVTSVYTHPDDPAETRWFDSVADLAASRSIQLFTPEDANEPGWIDRIRDDRPEALFSFYYRKLLCREILDIPSTGAFNMHGSLLPLYRGRCPVNWALIHGETVTGVMRALWAGTTRSCRCRKTRGRRGTGQGHRRAAQGRRPRLEWPTPPSAVTPVGQFAIRQRCVARWV